VPSTAAASSVARSQEGQRAPAARRPAVVSVSPPRGRDARAPAGGRRELDAGGSGISMRRFRSLGVRSLAVVRLASAGRRAPHGGSTHLSFRERRSSISTTRRVTSRCLRWRFTLHPDGNPPENQKIMSSGTGRRRRRRPCRRSRRPWRPHPARLAPCSTTAQLPGRAGRGVDICRATRCPRSVPARGGGRLRSMLNDSRSGRSTRTHHGGEPDLPDAGADLYGVRARVATAS
jgi:hypothetical protein